MKDKYLEKYLKYKAKYIFLKKNMTGGNRRIEVETAQLTSSGKFKSVELKKEEKTIYVTFKDDRLIKVKYEDDYPVKKPIIMFEDKHLLIETWSPSKKIIDFLDKFDEYTLIPFSDSTHPGDVYLYGRSSSSFIDVELSTLESTTVYPYNKIRIDLSKGTINNGKELLNAIKYILGQNYIIIKMGISGRIITEISDVDFINLKENKYMKLTIELLKIVSMNEYIDLLKKHTDINKISKWKPVATNKSGFEPTKFYLSWNLFSLIQKKIILDEMSKFLNVKFNIYQGKECTGCNPMIYYAEEYLDKLSKLFEHESLEKSLEILSIHDDSYTEKELDFIYIAFGDIISGLKKLDDLSENGKKIHAEYIKD